MSSSDSQPPVLIALDWGTSSLRAYHFAADGQVTGRRDTPRGILTVAPGDFPDTLRADTPDVRSLPLFGELRHQIWSLLHDEVAAARQQRRARIATLPARKESFHV